MGASSVTGVSGPGTSGKATGVELSNWSVGPAILIAGIASTGNTGEPPTSPPSHDGLVVFQKPLPGPATAYVVILTTKNGGKAYITDTSESGGNFTGFTFAAEFDCDVMYIVSKLGQRAS